MKNGHGQNGDLLGKALEESAQTVYMVVASLWSVTDVEH
jgi:cobalamin synthase